MDPISVIGLLGSVVGVLDVVTRSVNKLSGIRTKFRRATFLVSALHGHLCIVQAALSQLEEILRANSPHFVQSKAEIKVALEISLEGCGILVASLEEQLDKLYDENNEQMTAQGKLSFLWHDQDIKEYLDLLDRHVNALNLLLQAIQCRSLPEQGNLIQEDESLTVLRLARECIESLHTMNDAESRIGRESVISETTTKLSLAFDFDSQILGSKVYQAASKSNMRTLIKNLLPGRKKPQQSNDDQNPYRELSTSTTGAAHSPDATDLRLEKPLPLLPHPNRLPLAEDDRNSIHSIRSVASTVMTRVSNIISIDFIPGVTDKQVRIDDPVSPDIPISKHEGNSAEDDSAEAPLSNLSTLLQRAITLNGDVKRGYSDVMESNRAVDRYRAADISMPMMAENSLGWH